MYAPVAFMASSSSDKSWFRSRWFRGAEAQNAFRWTKSGTTWRLDFASWVLAWDRYAICAAVLGQMSFKAAMQHKACVAEVAFGAASSNKSTILAVLFDEVSRLTVCCVHDIQLIMCACIQEALGK